MIKNIIKKLLTSHFPLSTSAHRQKGFTLLELLVTVTIIGLLSAIIFVGLSVARARSRDVRRIADVRTLRTALDSYYINKKQYPPIDCLSSTALLLQDKTDSVNSALIAEGIISTPIKDPINTTAGATTYGIYYNSCGSPSDKTPDPDGSTTSTNSNEYYAITFVLETNSFASQGYSVGNNCVGPKISSSNNVLGSTFNGSSSCNPAP